MSRKTSLYERGFARLYDRFMYRVERVELVRRRRRLLAPLRGEILEIGAGTGANFPYYHTDARVLAIEPSQPMLERAEQRLAELATHRGKVMPQITLARAGMGDPELDTRIKNNSLDAIVCTLVLCTIPDAAGAIEGIVRWLKPGGTLVVIEHIRSHGKFGGIAQDIITPAWKLCAGGCHINRPTDRWLKAGPLRLAHEAYFSRSLLFYEAVFTRT